MPSTDTPAVEDLNGVRRALRDELIRLARDLESNDPVAVAVDPIVWARVLTGFTDAYVRLGGDLERGQTDDAQRALEQERDQAVIQGRRMADAIDALIATTQELGLDYFEGDAYADFRAAIEALRDSSPRMTPIRVHG